jgi:hypothetical protein
LGNPIRFGSISNWKDINTKNVMLIPACLGVGRTMVRAMQINGIGRSPVMAMMRAGMRVRLSMDSTAIGDSGGMFARMRIGAPIERGLVRRSNRVFAGGRLAAGDHRRRHRPSPWDWVR